MASTDGIGILAGLIHGNDQATPQLVSPSGQQGSPHNSAPATPQGDAYQPPSSQQETGVAGPSTQEATPPMITPKKKKRETYKGPFFKDIYPDMDPAFICAQSVEVQIRGIWNWWAQFCATKERTPWKPHHGLDLFHERTNNEDPQQYNLQLVDDYFKFLLEQKAPKTVAGKSKTFLNTHLKCEHHMRLKEAGLYPALVDVSVGKSKTVKNSINQVNMKAASRVFQEYVDIHADLHQLISPTDIRKMMTFVFEPKPGGKVSKMDPLNRIYFACHFNTLNSTTRRGEELYEQKIVQRATIFLPEIGPFGVWSSQFITNKAKHNKYGWFEYTSALTHKDPMRDSAAFHGLMWVYRFCIALEPIPPFTKDFKVVYSTYTYPSKLDPSKHIDKKKFSDNFDAFFLDADIICAKKVHQPRFQGTQEMDRAGLPEATQKRMTGHKGHGQSVHEKSYANNPPPQALVQRAGGDPNSQQNFTATALTPTPLEHMLAHQITNMLVPELSMAHEELCSRFAQTKTVEERKTERLYTLKGTAGHMLYEICQFVLMMATPPVDPVSFKINTNDRASLWTRYRHGPLSHLLSLPAFHSQQFKELQALVEQKLLEDVIFQSTLNQESKNAIEQFISSRIARPLHEMQRQNMAIMDLVRQQQEVYTQSQKETQRSIKEIREILVNMRSTTSPPSPRNHDQESDEDHPSVVPPADPGRLRRKQVKQHQLISEMSQSLAMSGKNLDPQRSMVFMDNHCQGFRDYWKLWKDRWKRLEEETLGGWRKDIGSSRARSSWWTLRSPMFRFVEHLISKGDEEEVAIEKAEIIFNSVTGIRKGNKRPIKKIADAFKRELAVAGINLKGRPKGRTASKARRRGPVRPDTTIAFATHFPDTGELAERFEEGRAEAAHLIQRRQELANQQAAAQDMKRRRFMWENANRHSRSLPPMPPNYGNHHPPPWRVPMGAPPLQYPPGHYVPDIPNL